MGAQGSHAEAQDLLMVASLPWFLIFCNELPSEPFPLGEGLATAFRPRAAEIYRTSPDCCRTAASTTCKRSSAAVSVLGRDGCAPPPPIGYIPFQPRGLQPANRLVFDTYGP
jgi:hypothetical protein